MCDTRAEDERERDFAFVDLARPGFALFGQAALFRLLFHPLRTHTCRFPVCTHAEWDSFSRPHDLSTRSLSLITSTYAKDVARNYFCISRAVCSAHYVILV